MTTTGSRSTRGGSGGSLPKGSSSVGTPEIPWLWQRDTSRHFRKEEEVLLPVLALTGGSQRASHTADAHPARPDTGLPCNSATNSADEIRRTRCETWASARSAHSPGRAAGIPPHRGTLPEHALQEYPPAGCFRAGTTSWRWVPAEGFSFDPWPVRETAKVVARTDTAEAPQSRSARCVPVGT